MTAQSDDSPEPNPAQRPLLVALAGSLMLWLAQPPLGWSLMAWVAPLPWLYLATTPEQKTRLPYMRIWLAGMAYWLCATHWIRLAHPATIVGLFFLAGYLGVYLPLFIMAVRQAVGRIGTPVWIAAPIAWVAIEWLEAHVFSGFLMAALSHTQIEHELLVQIADLGGAYLVSALVMLVASVAFELARLVVRAKSADQSQRKLLVSPAIGVVVALSSVAASYFYGVVRIEQYDSKLHPGPEVLKRVAIIQGNERAVWTADPDRDQRVMGVYLRLSSEAKQQASYRQIDLMVWPEGAFRTPLYSFAPELETGLDTPQFQAAASYAPSDLGRTVAEVGAPLLVGIDRVHQFDTQGMRSDLAVYNAAVAVDRQGEIIGKYDKTHLVPFGEYVPGAALWPGIYNYFPIGGVTPGERPVAFDIEGTRYMPTICYETVIPHVVRRQVQELSQDGQRPDVLVNITNDSWFYDSSELDMHLTCTRFRAIECRTPVVVAANGGLSANIDSVGRVLDVAQPMAEQVLMVNVLPGGESTTYLRHGDTFAIACLVGTVLVLLTRLPFVPFRHASRSHSSRRS